jgi:hypothetical protein
MFRSADELQSALLNHEPGDFVSHFLFEPIPFIFNGDLKLWIDWKSHLGSLIDIDPYDMVLTGSSAVGFSLNPNKNFKRFDENSDIDCGIVSNYYFDVAWRYLRNAQTNWLSLPGSTKKAIKDHRQHFVFMGTIATDRILGQLPFGRTWLHALEAMANVGPTEGRSVKLRIYKDYGALRHYQTHGLSRLREISLPTDAIEDHEIAIEDSSDLSL